jgi:hypothetical protein
MNRLVPQDIVRIAAAAEKAASRSATISIHVTPNQLQTLLHKIEEELQCVASDYTLTGADLEEAVISKAPLDPGHEAERDHLIRDVILLRALRRASANEFLKVA